MRGEVTAIGLEVREFCGYSLDEILAQEEAKDFRPLSAMEIMDARILAPPDAKIWHTSYFTPCLIAAGKFKHSDVVVFEHLPIDFSDYQKALRAIKTGDLNQQFYDLIGNARVPSNGNKLFSVVGYNQAMKTPHTLTDIEELAKHPYAIAACGNESRAIRYFQKYAQTYHGSASSLLPGLEMNRHVMFSVLTLGDCRLEVLGEELINGGAKRRERKAEMCFIGVPKEYGKISPVAVWKALGYAPETGRRYDRTASAHAVMHRT